METKTYIFIYFYLQSLVLFTIVLRNRYHYFLTSLIIRRCILPNTTGEVMAMQCHRH